MRKIHVITQKESVNENQLNDCTAVVIDVFLATSTIAFLLDKNYHPIYAVMDQNSALAVAKVQKGPYLLLGADKVILFQGLITQILLEFRLAKTNKRPLFVRLMEQKLYKRLRTQRDYIFLHL